MRSEIYSPTSLFENVIETRLCLLSIGHLSSQGHSSYCQFVVIPWTQQPQAWVRNSYTPILSSGLPISLLQVTFARSPNTTANPLPSVYCLDSGPEGGNEQRYEFGGRCFGEKGEKIQTDNSLSTAYSLFIGSFQC